MTLMSLSNTPVRAAELIELTPSADTFLSSAHADSSYGAAGGLAVSAAGLPKGEFRSVLRFDAASAKAQFDATFGVGSWTIQSIQLQLTPASPNNAIYNPQAAGMVNAAWLANDSWNEGAGTPNAPGTNGLTFNTLPTLLSPSDEPLGAFYFNGATNGSLPLPLAPSIGLDQDISDGAALTLLLSPGDNSASIVFNSRDFGNAANHPRLQITAIPEPVSVALLLMGGALASKRRYGERTRPQR